MRAEGFAPIHGRRRGGGGRHCRRRGRAQTTRRKLRDAHPSSIRTRCRLWSTARPSLAPSSCLKRRAPFTSTKGVDRGKSDKALVVGGGTGGYRRSQDADDLGYTVVVYDRGPPQPVSFDVPILETYQTYLNNAHVAPVKEVFWDGAGRDAVDQRSRVRPRNARGPRALVGGDHRHRGRRRAKGCRGHGAARDPPMMWQCIDPDAVR